ncbi:Sulfur acceptor protein CsdE [Saliniradius amylolyticus]|uniref:Sulfur acceptor protein CsdE n=2 Tax=Saliniradius amylolyticus TaxID=2183582 RepID=A0A2S2E1S9_9ALTE|nr:Sulfur acceptor protein CsdE [Saliniradius amylolyticus]
MRQLMLAGKQLAPLTPSEQCDDNEVSGCESQVWLILGGDTHAVQLRAYSTSKIIRGLLAVLMEPLQGQSVEKIQAFDSQAYLQLLGLERHLSQSRASGLNAVVKAIQYRCQSL